MLGYEIETVKEVNVLFAWLGVKLIVESFTKQQMKSILLGIGALYYDIFLNFVVLRAK